MDRRRAPVVPRHRPTASASCSSTPPSSPKNRPSTTPSSPPRSRRQPGRSTRRTNCRSTPSSYRRTGRPLHRSHSVRAGAVPVRPAGQPVRSRNKGGAASGRFRTDAPSPDKKKTAFIREYNLWVRDIATGKETQLTTDGVKDFSYALDNAGWVKSDRAILVWSPDSKKIATFQQDQRNVGEMYLVETRVGHPDAARVEVPVARRRDSHDDPAGDRGCGNGASHSRCRCRRPAPVHAVRPRGLPRQRVGGRGVEPGCEPAGVRLHLARPQAGALRTADAADGAVRDVMEESVATQYESGQGNGELAVSARLQ
jgi:hypothetical protein